MKIAVPEFQGRIAPVFDTCRRILIVVQNVDGDEIVSNEDWSTIARFGRAARLKELGVDTLICGGISCVMEEQIGRQGIRVIPWLSGAVPDVLGALRKGCISDPRYLMPGRGGAGCRRRRGARRVSAGRRAAQSLIAASSDGDSPSSGESG